MFIESNNYRFKLSNNYGFKLAIFFRENRGGEDVRTESMTTINNLVGIGLGSVHLRQDTLTLKRRAGQGCVTSDTLAGQEGLKWKKYSKGARRIRSERRWHYKRK